MPGRRIFLIGLALGLGLLAPVVFGVGGGGGGSTPSCTADSWSCSEWSSCSSAGQQARSCVKTYDCPSADTPSPATSQRCTPPATNTSVNTNSASTNSNQNSNSTTTPSPVPTETCLADTWRCSEWSLACDSHGRQERACSLSFDCPAAATPSPDTFRACDELQCGQKGTRRERILCRLQLAPDGLANELRIEFLPEECRLTTDTAERQECIEYYQGYQPCWSEQDHTRRLQCARNVLKLGPAVSEAVKACHGKTGSDRVDCQAELRDKVYDLIKFRLYDLEQRAEALGERGAPIATVADFVNTVEEKKIAFNSATTKNEKRQIILDVRHAWQQFIESVKDSVS